LKSTLSAIVAWQDVSAAVAIAAKRLGALAGGDILESAQMAQRLLSQWLPPYQKDSLSWAEVRRLKREAIENDDWARKSAGTKGVADVLHNTIIMKTFAFWFKPLAASASLREAANGEEVVAFRSQIIAMSARLAKESPTPELLRRLADLLRQMPQVADAGGGITGDGGAFRRIVIVEDDAMWAERLEVIVRDVIRRTGASVDPDIEIVTNSKEAIDWAERSKPKRASDGDVDFPLILLDLSIPATRDASSDASPEEGLSLLRELRRYGIQAAVVVITAPWRDLRIHQSMISAGVPEEWIIYKGEDIECQVESKLNQLIRQLNRQITLRIQEGPPYSAIIDGARIELNPADHALLRTIADLSRRKPPDQRWLRPRTILEAMGRDISAQEEEDLSKAESLLENRLLSSAGGSWAQAPPEMRVSLLNVARFWAAARKQCPDDVGLSFRKFNGNAPPAVKRFLEQAYNWLEPRTAPRQAPADWKALNDGQRAGWLASHFGLNPVDSSSQDPSKMVFGQKIGDLRRAIYNRLAAVPRYCHPQAVVETKMVATDRGSTAEYRIPCRIENDRHKQVQRPLRVLVVEDDDQHREVIRRTLADNGHEVVQATNRDDAIRLAIFAHKTGAPFDVLSLDLHIPADSEAYSFDPFSGEKSNGVDVLRRIVEEGIEAKVVVPTTLSNDDELRQYLVDLGVRVSDFVPKGGPDWEVALVRSIERFGRERIEGAVLPQSDDRSLPVIRILSSATNRITLEINGQKPKIPLTDNQARFVITLLSSANQIVPYQQLVPAVYGMKLKPERDENRLKSLKRVVQNKLVTAAGLDLDQRGTHDIIENRRGQGYILHCVVVEKGKLAPVEPTRQVHRAPSPKPTAKNSPGSRTR
jgi:CheY-like chemotaxis protein